MGELGENGPAPLLDYLNYWLILPTPVQTTIPKFTHKLSDCPQYMEHGVIKLNGFAWCGHCGYLAKERYHDVHAPKIKWLALPKFDLSQLGDKFAIANFERNVSERHINSIVKNIMQNKFYDIVLRVIEQDKKWIIIDAQHRMQALMKCHEKYGLQTYDLMLAIYSSADARGTYRGLNVGKKLTAYDHSYAMDDGEIEFFNELKPYLAHYRQINKLAFVDMIYAFRIAKSINAYTDPSGEMSMLDMALPKITTNDIAYAKEFLRATQTDSISNSIIHKYSVFRFLFKACYSDQLTMDQMLKLIKLVQNSQVVKDGWIKRNRLANMEIDQEIKKLTKQVLGV